MKTKSGKRSVKTFIVNPTINQKTPMLLLYKRTLRHPRKGTEIPFPGYWDLFGGATEQGESDLEAILRELREEIVCSSPLRNFSYIGEIEPIKGEDLDPLAVYRTEIEVPINEMGCTEGWGLVYFEPDELEDESFKLPPFFKRFYSKHKDEILNYQGPKNNFQINFC